MSDHRRHYLDLNGPAASRPSGAERHAPSWLLALLAMALLLTHVLAALWPKSDPVVTPVRTPVVMAYELPALSVEDARIEGFRAGYAAATEQGCHQPVLQQPLEP